jgi:hypothetical protein
MRKIILFGSYAYGTPEEESDIDIYVTLKDGGENPCLALEDIYCALGDHKFYEIDVLANYKSRYEYRGAGPTMERTWSLPRWVDTKVSGRYTRRRGNDGKERRGTAGIPGGSQSRGGGAGPEAREAGAPSRGGFGH